MSRIHPTPALPYPGPTSTLASPMSTLACCAKATGVLLIGLALATAVPSAPSLDALAALPGASSARASGMEFRPQPLASDTLIPRASTVVPMVRRQTSG